MADLDALLTMVREDTNDASRWAVLSDAILESGDRRQELIEAADGIECVLQANAEDWFGRPAKAEGNQLSFREDLDETWSPGVVLEFERGHVRKLKVETTWDGDRSGWGQEWMHPLLTRILSLPVGQLTTELEIRATPNSEFFYEGLIESITAAAPLAARALYCGDDDQLSWTMVPDCSALWAAAPYLETVTLEGSLIELGKLEHERLRSLKLISGGLPASPLRSLVNGHTPALEVLELWFGDSEYGAECSIETVRPLLAKPLPALRSIALINCEFSDELVPLLPEAVWLGQLETLKLGGSILRDPAGEALIAAADSFRHLKGLDVSGSFLSDDMVLQLSETFGDCIALGDQQVADEYNGEAYYYVSLGE